MTEEEICLVLNTYMYLDYKEAKDNMTLKDIVAELSTHEDCRPGGSHYGEYQVISKAVRNSEIGSLVIGNQSHQLGFDSGTAACSFSDPNGTVYVVYRGTGDGEWPDNGLGMTEVSTTQQERAAEYFDAVTKREQITKENRLVVTGHSKGGNKAQYVTMAAAGGGMIDACYNIDGQGFSEMAIAAFRENLGEKEYQTRREKITGLYGENDYVNVLGISIVPKENIKYIRTPVEKENFAGYHDIKYMFAEQVIDSVSGEVTYLFHGEKNAYVGERGELAEYAQTLSDAMMKLPKERRDGCAAVIMQLLELGGVKKTGLNGEVLSATDVDDFLWLGVPLITGTLFRTRQGTELFAKTLLEKSYAKEMQGQLAVQASYGKMEQKAQEIRLFAEEITGCMQEAELLERDFARYMKNNPVLKGRLTGERRNLEKSIKELKILAKKLETVVHLYRSWDVEMSESLSS